MICSETYGPTSFRSRLGRRTYSSIRCSRQTQRTQLESTKNKSLNEQNEQQQYLRQGCHTILTGQSSACQNNEQRDVSGTDSCIFIRGPKQLRDSRRKTAEQWQSRKHSPVNNGNRIEEIRRSQKVKFSSSINNRSFLRNLRNTVENKEILQISTMKHPKYTQTHLLPSITSSPITLKSNSRNFKSNFGLVYHSDSSYSISSCTKPKELHLKSAGLHEIHVNTSAQNQKFLNEEVS